MLDFKPKRNLKIKKSTPLSRFLSNSVARYCVAGFFSVLVTLLLFIFMNYLLGNFDKYAISITENLFSLHLIKADKNHEVTNPPDKGFVRIPRPVEPPEQPVIQEDDKPLTNQQRRKMLIESILEKSKETDNNDNDNNSSPEQPGTGPD